MSRKDEFRQQLKSKIAGWRESVRDLEETASAADANVHPEMQARIRELWRRVDAGEAKLVELGEAADDDWQALKEEIESTVFAGDEPGVDPE